MQAVDVPSNRVENEVREVFRNFGRYLVEFFMIRNKFRLNSLMNHTEVENQHYLDEVLKLGKGGIIASAHFGNWEMGAGIVSQLGYSISVIALTHAEENIDHFFINQRMINGVRSVTLNHATKETLNILNRNEFVGIIVDRDFTGNGEELKIFNRLVKLPKGAAVMSLKTGAPIIPCFCLRTENGQFKFIVSKPIYPELDHKQEKSVESSFRKDQILSIMKRYISEFEAIIRKHPSQWVLFRRFWLA